MPTVDTSIDVKVPVETAYDQWRQFETLPQFMDGVKQVKGFNDHPWQWTNRIAPSDKEREAKISGKIGTSVPP